MGQAFILLLASNPREKSSRGRGRPHIRFRFVCQRACGPPGRSRMADHSFTQPQCGLDVVDGWEFLGVPGGGRQLLFVISNFAGSIVKTSLGRLWPAWFKLKPACRDRVEMNEIRCRPRNKPQYPLPHVYVHGMYNSALLACSTRTLVESSLHVSVVLFCSLAALVNGRTNDWPRGQCMCAAKLSRFRVDSPYMRMQVCWLGAGNRLMAEDPAGFGPMMYTTIFRTLFPRRTWPRCEWLHTAWGIPYRGFDLAGWPGSKSLSGCVRFESTSSSLPVIGRDVKKTWDDRDEEA